MRGWPRSGKRPRTTARAGREAAQGDALAPRYTVDELAFAAGVPSRTIRFYQSKGVLPRPARRGRVAFYGDRHVERLRLIGKMQDRGLSLRAVRHLVRQDSEDARLLSRWLGLGESLGKPWSDDQARIVDQRELDDLAGERPPGTMASLVRLGVVRREPGGPPASYRVFSPGLLRVTLALEESRVDIETAVGAGDILRRHLRAAARQLVEHFSKRAGRGFGQSTAPDEIAAALDALRPLAGDAARLIFAREIERALRDGPGSHRPRTSPRGRRPAMRGR
jgi:DNA-binding transcriptional MerR regulator